MGRWLRTCSLSRRVGFCTSFSLFGVDVVVDQVSVSSSPPLITASTTADFVFTTTAQVALVQFQYRLDGLLWTACDASLHLDGVGIGLHNVAARAVSIANDSVVSGVVTYVWQVVASNDSVISSAGDPDGKHRVTIVAAASNGGVSRVEPDPLTAAWTVDTVPPLTVVTLVTPSIYNGPSAVVNVSCVGEAFLSGCSYCWRTFVDTYTAASCTTNR